MAKPFCNGITVRERLYHYVSVEPLCNGSTSCQRQPSRDPEKSIKRVDSSHRKSKLVLPRISSSGDLRCTVSYRHLAIAFGYGNR
jgi:hypothetical protein